MPSPNGPDEPLTRRESRYIFWVLMAGALVWIAGITAIVMTGCTTHTSKGGPVAIPMRHG